MSLLTESIAILRRNPLTASTAVFLIAIASMAQVISLGSLFPILQVLLSGGDGSQDGPTGGFVRALEAMGAEPTLANLLLLFGVLGLGYCVLNWCAEVFQGLHLRNFENAIRCELFGSAIKSDWTYAKTLRHGEFINVITREATQYKFVVKYALHTFSALLHFAVLFAYATYLDWRLTSLGTLMFAAGSIVLIPVLRYANHLGQRNTRLATLMSNSLVSALRSLKTVKALSLEPFLVRRLQPSFSRLAVNYFHQNMLASGQYAIMEIMAFATIAGLLYVGLAVFGMPQAELFIVLLLCFRALPQVRVGVDNYHKGASYFASVEAVKRHLTAASRARERHGDTPVSRNWQLLECRNVSFSYDGGADILHDFSASIRRSEFWAILGPSGSGKTTALDLILGLLKPVSGSVRIDGSELETLDLATWHQQIAYLGQEPFAFAGTLRENLQWGADEPLTDLSLSDALRAARLGHSLDKEVGESGSELSGGEKQRLALARLFLRQPTLLILDEPTAALDRDTEKDILESISTLFQDTTMVLVTHREELTHDADHIVRFSDGSVRIESRTDRPAPAGW